MANIQQVPTINDLRVKLCYICREEESYDQPSVPRRKWVHPCNCTLIAHESCLLEWIHTAEENPSRSPDSAFKCPQCAAEYVIESNNPVTLRLMDLLETIINEGGRVVTVASVGVVAFSLAGGLYLLCTSYGAYAIRQLVGEKMYQNLLTDDPSNWSAFAWIQLPTIPLSLISSSAGINTIPLLSVLSLWYTQGDCRPDSNYFEDFLARIQGSKHPVREAYSIAIHDTLFSWPPSAFTLMVGGALFVRWYRRSFAAFSKWVLNRRQGPQVGPNRPAAGHRLVFNNWQMEMRIQGDILGDDDVEAAQLVDNEVNNGDVVAANPPNGQQADNRRQPVTIRITAATLGRFIAGALLLPPVANAMGSLLFRLSKHSHFLRQLLAIRPPALLGPFSWSNSLRSKRHVRDFPLKLVLPAVWTLCGGGHPLWRSNDPVWWRNTVGAGMYMLVRDCIGLYHSWLSERELRTRRIQDKAFDNVDPSQLDLIQRSENISRSA